MHNRSSKKLKPAKPLYWPIYLVPVEGLESIQLISRIFVNTRFTRMDIAQSASRAFGLIFFCAQIRARNDLFGSPKWPQRFPDQKEGGRGEGVSILEGGGLADRFGFGKFYTKGLLCRVRRYAWQG